MTTERGRLNGTATLVHCRVGVSRSATICIAEVMKTQKLSFPRAYCYVRARRLNVIIQPHLRFAYELLKWEELLRTREAAAAEQAVQDDDEVEDVAFARRPRRASSINRELEWGEISREVALMNRPYAR
jgi:dual specificity MAP kinase phosphatase